MTTTATHATLEIRKTQVNGAPAILLVVKESRLCTGLSDLLDTLGVEPTPDVWNHRSVVCTTPEALDAIRDRLRPYCNAAGVFVTPVTSIQ